MKNFIGKFPAFIVASVWCITTVYSQPASGIYSLGISVDGKVAFKWKANAETNLAGYKLYIGTTPGVYSSVVDVGVVTTFELTRLIEGMTYYFALTAYDTTGLESDFTPELTYQVPLEASNAPPTLDAISDITLPEDSGPHIIALRGIRPGSSNEVQTLSIAATSSNPDLIAHPIVNYSDPDLAGSLSFQPIANASGTAVITVSVDDGELENSRVSQSFTVTVQPVNDPPYFDAMPDIVIEEGVINHSVLLAGIHSGAVNEADPLTVTATSSETNLIGISELIPSTPETSALLVLNPVPGASGTATITATVNDGQSESSTFSRSFQATLVNTPPTISAIPDQFVPRNHTSDPIPFRISDAGTAAADLQVTATSSNPSVVPPSGLILEGFDNKRALMIDPANGRGGVSIITLTVSDRSASTSVSFQVTVDAQ